MGVKVLVISDYREKTSSRPEAELFIGLQKAGLDISIMTYPDTPWTTAFREAGIRMIEFHPDKKFNRDSIARIRQELVAGSYQILHMFNSKASSNGIPAAKGLPVKVVLYRGYTGHIHWYDPGMYSKYLHPRVDAIFCIAPAIVELFKKNTLFGRNKAVYIAKGHDLSWYEKIEKAADFTAFGIPPDAFVVMNTANVRPMKGIPYLIRATYELPADLPIHFLLVGRGFDRPEIKQLLEKSPYRDRIHCPGFISDALRYVAAADLFVLPSVKGEAITKSVIEAMALGVPPVITAIPGNKELVVNEESGLVVPSKNPSALAKAIVRLYRNDQLRQQLGEAAKLHIAKRLNIKNTIEETKLLYQSLASEIPISKNT